MIKTKLNLHQLEAKRLIQNVMSDMVGGYENQRTDYEEGSEDWNTANDFLNTERIEMVNLLYDMVIEESQDIGNSKHINFAGTKFIKETIDKELDDWGY